MAELRGGTTIAGYRAIHEGLPSVRLTGNVTINGAVAMDSNLTVQGEIKTVGGFIINSAQDMRLSGSYDGSPYAEITKKSDGTYVRLKVSDIILDDGTSLKTSVSDGKTSIATAITDKGVSTSSSDTFSTMATNIGNIKGGSGGELTYTELRPKPGSRWWTWGLTDTDIRTGSNGLFYGNFCGIWEGNAPWKREVNAVYYYFHDATNGGLLTRLDIKEGTSTDTFFSGLTYDVGWFFVLDGYNNCDFALYDDTSNYYRAYKFDGSLIYSRSNGRDFSFYNSVKKMRYSYKNTTINKSWGQQWLTAWNSNYVYSLRYYDGYAYSIHFDSSYAIDECAGMDDMVYIVATSGNTGYIRKESYSGSYYWQKSTNFQWGTSTTTSYVSSVALDSDHNIYISLIQFGGTDSIQKYDANGALQWHIDVTSRGNPDHISIVELSNGSELLLVGSYQKLTFYSLGSGDMLSEHSFTENSTGNRHYMQAITDAGDIATYDSGYDIHRMMLGPGTYVVK